jgi:plasmid maintenance system antidote protein VapI
MNSRELIEAVKQHTGVATDYGIAKLLDTQPTTVTNWVRRQTAMSDDYVVRCAEILGRDPVLLLALIRAEQASGPSKNVWEKLAASLTAGAFCLIVAHEKHVEKPHNSYAYYVKRRRRPRFPLKFRPTAPLRVAIRGGLTWGENLTM